MGRYRNSKRDGERTPSQVSIALSFSTHLSLETLSRQLHAALVPVAMGHPLQKLRSLLLVDQAALVVPAIEAVAVPVEYPWKRGRVVLRC